MHTCLLSIWCIAVLTHAFLCSLYAKVMRSPFNNATFLLFLLFLLLHYALVVLHSWVQSNITWSLVARWIRRASQGHEMYYPWSERHGFITDDDVGIRIKKDRALWWTEIYNIGYPHANIQTDRQMTNIKVFFFLLNFILYNHINITR